MKCVLALELYAASNVASYRAEGGYFYRDRYIVTSYRNKATIDRAQSMDERVCVCAWVQGFKVLVKRMDFERAALGERTSKHQISWWGLSWLPLSRYFRVAERHLPHTPVMI